MGKKSRRNKASGSTNKGGGKERKGINNERLQNQIFGPPSPSIYVPDTSTEMFGPEPSAEAVANFWEWFLENEETLCTVGQLVRTLSYIICCLYHINYTPNYAYHILTRTLTCHACYSYFIGGWLPC